MRGCHRTAALAAAVTLTLGAAGCVGPLRGAASAHAIRVISDPPGATVLADGRELGTTPLTIRPGEVFPARFVGREYRYVGTLTLRRPGCKPWSVQVNDAVLAKDVVARLECAPGAAAPAPARTQAPAAGGEDPVVVRLRRAKRLHDEGLITDEEYRALRRRILESL